MLAVAYDLKVFFTVVGKPPRRVRPVDVLAFITAQRAGGQGRLQIAGAGDGGVSAKLAAGLASAWRTSTWNSPCPEAAWPTGPALRTSASTPTLWLPGTALRQDWLPSAIGRSALTCKDVGIEPDMRESVAAFAMQEVKDHL